MVASSRELILDRLADRIAAFRPNEPQRVAVDGRTASGKTTFADELASALRSCGREIVRTSIDGFHRPKVERYARGRYSAEGYYWDARDLPSVRRLLLEPLGPGGNRRYSTVSFDLDNDRWIEPELRRASVTAILIVDGTFLQRPELSDGWDLTIFLDVPEEVATQRGVTRDAAKLGGVEEARRLYELRYRPAFELYARLCSPSSISDVLVCNNDLAHPDVQLRKGGRLSGKDTGI
jgi:uridine kinase